MFGGLVISHTVDIFWYGIIVGNPVFLIFRIPCIFLSSSGVICEGAFLLSRGRKPIRIYITGGPL